MDTQGSQPTAGRLVGDRNVGGGRLARRYVARLPIRLPGAIRLPPNSRPAVD